MALGFLYGAGGGGQPEPQDFNLIPDLVINPWTNGGSGAYTGSSQSFPNNTIYTHVQIQATNTGSYYQWASTPITASKYKKLIVSNSVVTGGSNPGGFTSYIDVYVNNTLLTSISGSHTKYEVNLPSSMATISVNIRTTMAGSGGTWPYCDNTITELTLTNGGN